MLKRRLLRAFGHQRYLRFGVRDRVLRRFDDPERSDGAEFTTPFYGAQYRGRFDTFIDWSTYYYGAYERDDLELIDDMLSAMDAPVFVDIGANVGHHALFAATRCRRVIAIEPFPPLVARLRQKIDDNRLTNVIVVACGLGDREAEALYAPPMSHNTGTGSFAQSAATGSVPLPIRRGDEVLAELQARPDFIKIDTEGFERPVLRGLRGTLAEARPLVFFEWSPGDLADGDGARDLFPAQYLFYRRRPDAVTFGVFRRPVLALERLAGSWPESDVLAVPVEFRDRVRRSPSGARAALRLADD